MSVLDLLYGYVYVCSRAFMEHVKVCGYTGK